MYKILIADDEKLVRDVIARFLALKGYSVGTAENGTETVRKVSEGNIDLLIMDLRMPGLRSDKILEQIKKTNAELPIIILTGTIDAEESEVLNKWGFSNNEILCKPADLFDILKKVQENLPKENTNAL